MYLGHENAKSDQELISYIANTVKERVAGILGNSNFLSILTDGSQVFKTGSDKELVFNVPKEVASFLFIYTYKIYLRLSYMIILIENTLLATRIRTVLPSPQVAKLSLGTLKMECFDFLSFIKSIYKYE